MFNSTKYRILPYYGKKTVLGGFEYSSVVKVSSLKKEATAVLLIIQKSATTAWNCKCR